MDSGDQLARLVPAAHRRWVQDGAAGTFDVVVAPGQYRGTPLVLDAPKGESLSVAIRAADPAHPPRLIDSPVTAVGASVRIAHLVFAESATDRPLLRVVATRVDIEGCAFVDNALGLITRDRALVELSPSWRPATSPRVCIERSWFLGNRSARDWSLVRLPAAPPGFAAVHLQDVVMAANDVRGVETGATAEVRCEGCWLEASATLFALFYARTQLVVERSTVLGPDLEELVAFGPAGADVPPVFRQSTLGVDAPTVDCRRFALDATTVETRPGSCDLHVLRHQQQSGLAPDPARLRLAYR